MMMMIDVNNRNDLKPVLRQQADLIRQWNAYELGMRAPKALDYAALAKLLDDAADRIEQLEAPITI